METIDRVEPANLPTGFSFMSVRVSPPDESSVNDSQLAYVPETTYRHGYILQTAFTATPFP